jgi:hypothetical protein
MYSIMYSISITKREVLSLLSTARKGIAGNLGPSRFSAAPSSFKRCLFRMPMGFPAQS